MTELSWGKSPLPGDILKIWPKDEKGEPVKPACLTHWPGYKNGIDYKKLSSSMPYMYSDEPEWIDFVADAGIVDQIIDWFGNDIRIAKSSDNENQVKVSVVASPNAMEHWAMQYINYVEVISPPAIRDRIRDGLQHGISKYSKI